MTIRSSWHQARQFVVAAVLGIVLVACHSGQTKELLTRPDATTADNSALSAPFLSDATGLEAVDANTAFVVSGSGIGQTHDGGSRWTDRSSASGFQGASVLAAHYDNSNTGWVLAAKGSVVKLWTTKNGGSTYAPVSTLANVANIAAASITTSPSGDIWISADLGSNANFVYAALLKSQDGGLTWSRSNSPTGGPVVVVDSARAFSVGGPGSELFMTTNGADSWSKVDLSRDLPDGSTVAYGVPSTTAAGLILPVTVIRDDVTSVYWFRSADGGENWTARGSVAIPDYSGVGPGVAVPTAVMDGSNWIVARTDGVREYATSDAGDTWTTIAPNGVRAVTKLTFVNKRDGWLLESLTACKNKTVCQQSSRVLRTTSGGLTWEIVRSSAGSSSKP